MENKLPFGKKNYQWMITAVATLAIGFVIMSLDKEPFGFGFLGLSVGPLVVMAGFLIGVLSILVNPDEEKKQKK